MDRHSPELPRWVLPLFIVGIAVSFGRTHAQNFLDTRGTEAPLITGLPSDDVPYSNILWDDFCYIPKMNSVATGHLFSDSWNSFNPAFVGWGAFGPVCAIIGGIFLRVFHDYFFGLFVWSLMAYALIPLLVYWTLRREPVAASPPVAILLTFLFVSYMWLVVLPPEYARLLHFPLLGSYLFAETDIDAGLFTYPPFILFLWLYWRFVTDPRRKNAVLVGCAAGVLTYVYYYHYIFAFAMIAVCATVKLARRRFSEAKLSFLALMAGLIVAVPFFINNAYFWAAAPADYIDRIGAARGRTDFSDYQYLLYLISPVIIGLLYSRTRRRSSVRGLLIEMLVIIAIAYAGVLSLRVVIGFSMQSDHYWRQSLAIPATFWFMLLLADLSQPLQRVQLIRYGALALPFFLIVRTGMAMAWHVSHVNTAASLTESQRQAIDVVKCVGTVVEEGEGFLASEPELNYLVVSNLKVKPFVPFALSPIPTEAAIERSMMASYLVGAKPLQLSDLLTSPQPFAHISDQHLYFFYQPSTRITRPVSQAVMDVISHFNPDQFDWAAHRGALGSVQSAFVRSANAEVAQSRLNRFYEITRDEGCSGGTAYRLKLR